MSNRPVLCLKNISYSYDGKTNALEDVQLNIYSNEKIAILGSNGAGKSTLFLCMNGVITPDQGEIWLNDVFITNQNKMELRKNVGIVFQDAESQIVAPTVLSEVSFGPMNLKLPQEEIKKRTHQALQYMNLTSFSHRPPHYLSGGEKKRVTIADIIAMQSNVILFDEPTTALDPYHQKGLEEVLQKLSQEGKSVIVSTHDMDFAYGFAERAIVFDNGKIIADSNIATVFENDAVLKKAHLRKPYLFEITQLLRKKGILKNDGNQPKSVKELEKSL